MIDPHPHPGSIITESFPVRQANSLHRTGVKRIMAASVDYDAPTAKAMNAFTLVETRNHVPLAKCFLH
jgi:hypothetical protein